METITQSQFAQSKQYSRMSLIKTDKNGSQYYEGFCPCPRCNGKGIVYTHVLNGQPVPAMPDSGVCWKCLGAKVVKAKIKVVTDDYAKVLEAKHVDKKVKTVEEANKKLEEAKQYRVKRNLELGYKEVDFTFAEWFEGPLNLYFGWKYCRVVKETEKACLLSFTNFLDIEESNMYQTWLPKKAIVKK